MPCCLPSLSVGVWAVLKQTSLQLWNTHRAQHRSNIIYISRQARIPTLNLSEPLLFDLATPDLAVRLHPVLESIGN